ncbi:band 3 anion transport protein-like [Amphiura filiformis]|uniref:band 3 anion transport protein-like n=1 Tax=Amphiura filiformis TaxID=82378 RepID=UPI003B222270
MPGITIDDQPARPVVQMPKKNNGKQKTKMPSVENKPREQVFVELHELERSRMQWEQKARWIKYEQNAEGGLYRWSRPHIAHMSFQSLIELRKTLEKGALLLDIPDTDPSQIFHSIVEELVRSGQIPDASKTDVMRALLYQHKHVEENNGILRGMSTKVRRNTASRQRRLTRSRSQTSERAASYRRQNNLFATPSHLVGQPTEETGNSDDVTVHFTNGGSTDIRMPILNGASGSSGLSRHAGQSHLDDLELEDITRLGIPVDAEDACLLVGQLNSLDKPASCFVRLSDSAPMSALTEVALPVRFIFLLLGPIGGKMDYHELGRCFGTLMSSEHFAESAYKADNINTMISAMNDFIDDTVVLPAGSWDKDLLLPVLRIQNEKVEERKLRKEIELRWRTDPSTKPLPVNDDTTPMTVPTRTPEIDPLKRTKIPFGGLYNDVKRRYPHYLSDFTDALNGQCVAAVMFIFFAALSPAITFGGLLGEKTDNWMGISEMVISTAIAGIVFAMFSGQPLNIIGVTGPILVFEENLYKFCVSSEIEYLPFRFWVGLWMLIWGIVCVAVEGSVLVRFFTRFTTDIFSFLIAVIFIYEVFSKLFQIYSTHPLMEMEEYCIDGNITDEYEFMNVSAYIDLNGTVINNGTVVGVVTTAAAAATATATAATAAAKTAAAAGGAAATIWPTNMALATTTAAKAAIATTVPNGAFAFTSFMTTPFDNETYGNGTGSGATMCGSKKVNMVNQPNTALLSTVLMFGTFMLANAFKFFKTSQYFGKTCRKIVADFGIPLSILIMVGKDLLIAGVYTQKLDVPNGLVPTDGCKRGWFVNPLGMEKPMHIMWIFAAAIPALLAFILMFMESLITALIVNKKDNKLKKGSGFHLDMLILAGLAAFNGLFGLPWVWAATVRSVTHVGALTVYSKGAPGEKPKLEMIREQRVTALIVALLIGLSIALAPLLKHVPLAVLFGVFLYMGVSSLNGIQFADRVFMLLMPVKHHADEKYVRGIRTWRMHMFTLIQLACVAMLWSVKISPAALAFPFFLIILVPIRGQLKRIFTQEELAAIDAAEAGDPEPVKED